VNIKDSTYKPDLAIDPFGLDVFMGKEKPEYLIKVTNQSKKEFGLKLVSFDHNYMKVQVPAENIKPGKSRDIKVKLLKQDGDPASTFEKSFTIELSDSAKTRYTIPVTYTKQNEGTVAQNLMERAGEGMDIKPTGLRTRTGNEIDLIEAGTRKNK